MRFEKWREVLLGEIAEIQTGPFGSQLHASDYVQKGVPCIMPTNIGKNLNIDTTEISRVAHEDVERLKRHKVDEGDIVYSRRGDIEKCALIKKEQVGWLCGTGCLKVRFKKEFIDPSFGAYFLSQYEIKSFLTNRAVGATMPNLNTGILSEIPMLLPGLPTQRRIAAILTALDDKIELNRRMNETLEGIAQALWQEWFGKYAGGEEELPEGWRWGKLGDVCEVNQSTLSKNVQLEWIDYIEISEVNRGKVGSIVRYKRGAEPSRAKRRIQHGDIVLSTVRPDRGAYFLSLHPEETIIVSTGFAVFTPVTVPYCFLYILLTQSEMLDFYGHMANGGAYPAINPSVILEKGVVVPDANKLYEFQKITEPIFEKIYRNHYQSKKLTELRDALLPRLMRGEIQV